MIVSSFIVTRDVFHTIATKHNSAIYLNRAPLSGVLAAASVNVFSLVLASHHFLLVLPAAQLEFSVFLRWKVPSDYQLPETIFLIITLLHLVVPTRIHGGREIIDFVHSQLFQASVQTLSIFLGEAPLMPLEFKC